MNNKTTDLINPTEHDMPLTGFVRLPSVLGPKGPIPMSKSAWYAGVKQGKYPQPVKLSARITCWRVEDIRTLIENPQAWEPAHG
jgi:predicted DNA-binding transcriptional regulator AlpA